MVKCLITKGTTENGKAWSRIACKMRGGSKFSLSKETWFMFWSKDHPYIAEQLRNVATFDSDGKAELTPAQLASLPIHVNSFMSDIREDELKDEYEEALAEKLSFEYKTIALDQSYYRMNADGTIKTREIFGVQMPDKRDSMTILVPRRADGEPIIGFTEAQMVKDILEFLYRPVTLFDRNRQFDEEDDEEDDENNDNDGQA